MNALSFLIGAHQGAVVFFQAAYDDLHHLDRVVHFVPQYLQPSVTGKTGCCGWSPSFIVKHCLGIFLQFNLQWLAAGCTMFVQIMAALPVHH
jgi:hypothetical protein